MKLNHVATAMLLLSGVAQAAVAREVGNWEAIPQDIRDWFTSLMQPDNPSVSCCGEGDAYWADDYEVDGDEYVAIITDDRGEIYDAKVGRESVEVGRRVPIPNRKIKWDSGNPTGHGIVFLSTGGSAICYLPPPGI